MGTRKTKPLELVMAKTTIPRINNPAARVYEVTLKVIVQACGKRDAKKLAIPPGFLNELSYEVTSVKTIKVQP
jgi:hypothetical protein